MSLAVPSPNNATSLAALKERTRNLPPETPLSFFSAGGLYLMQRAATMLSCSTLVPTAYRNFTPDKKTGQMIKNESALSNCVLALNMAQRIGADPLMIMQNLYIVEGRPGWSSQFVIASINACGKFSPLRFRMEDLGEKEVEWKTTKWVDGPNGRRVPKEETHKAKIRNKACTAWAVEKATGEKIEGPTVSMETAVAEGWFGKNGSKWQTMPDVMLRYRAASFFGKLYAPELLMGLQTAEEVRDATITMEPGEDGSFEMTMADLSQTEEASPQNEPENDAPGPAENNATVDPANGKQAADRQRAAKAASRIKAKAAAKTGQADLQDVNTQAEPVSTEVADIQSEAADIQCPREGPEGKPRMVAEEDCWYCKERKGCPVWTEEF